MAFHIHLRSARSIGRGRGRRGRTVHRDHRDTPDLGKGKLDRSLEWGIQYLELDIQC